MAAICESFEDPSSFETFKDSNIYTTWVISVFFLFVVLTFDNPAMLTINKHKRALQKCLNINDS